MKVQVFKHSKHQQLQEIRLLESKIRWVYSNFLKDGFPVFWSLQWIRITANTAIRFKVEILKGSASTLGGGAIAGLVNLISKIP
jgi:outer membrane receptor protein involved in Fe transport